MVSLNYQRSDIFIKHAFWISEVGAQIGGPEPSHEWSEDHDRNFRRKDGEAFYRVIERAENDLFS